MRKPMLAAPSDGEDLTYPLYASPKLDGVRALIIGGVVMSRSLKPIPNKYVQSVLGHQLLNGFDGELIVGDPTAKDVYNKTVSGVMRRDGEPNFTFIVFDDFTTIYLEYQVRHGQLYSRFKELKKQQSVVCEILGQTAVGTKDYLDQLESRYLQEGYEGVMLRRPNSPYKFGRSTLKEGYLLKLKRFLDAEAMVVGTTQLMHNTNEAEVNELGYKERSSKKEGKVGLEQIGALRVRDVQTGVEFEIGTGFTEAMRQELWKNRGSLIGKLVKYKSQPTGVKDKPRFPVFLGFRSMLDL